MKELFLDIELTEEQEAEAAHLEDVLGPKARAVVRYISRLLASKPNRELFGETEFQIRDAVHRLGAEGMDSAVAERKKRGTKEPASCVPTATRTPDFSGTAPAS